VIGAEAAASPVFTGALAAGRPVTVPLTDTIADGLAGNMEPDSQTFGIVRDLVDDVMAVQKPTSSALSGTWPSTIDCTSRARARRPSPR
jgi:threonine dehydratase